MDDEARRQLEIKALLQHARAEAKRARANLPLGFALMLLGIALATVVAIEPVGLMATVVVGGVGLLFIPGGIAVIVKALAALSHERRMLREHTRDTLPAARVIK